MDTIIFPGDGIPENEVPDPEFDHFRSEVERLCGIKLNLYKEKQMKRRINTLILRKHKTGYTDFIELLESDPMELKAFIDYITINVTEFFRTPEHWKYLEQEVFPELAGKASGLIKIWSSACSTGEEPYSLAMNISDHMLCGDRRILATDIDEGVLEKAKNAVYDAKAVASLPKDKLERYFRQEGNGYRVQDFIRKSVEFRKLDLLQDEYPGDCDLIVCRNVLIYFTEEAKDMIYEKFWRSLSSGGYLFTGSAEQIIYYKKLGYQKVKSFLYRKP